MTPREEGQEPTRRVRLYHVLLHDWLNAGMAPMVAICSFASSLRT
ncbi:MAG: hypothetical protein AAYR33_09895 [Acetobacteraceae bacterium]